MTQRNFGSLFEQIITVYDTQSFLQMVWGELMVENYGREWFYFYNLGDISNVVNMFAALYDACFQKC